MSGPHPHATHADLHAHGTSAAVERAMTELATRGERVTAPRRAVVEALAAEHEHRTAEEVVEALGGARPPVHRATVYRTLDRLSELGIVTRTRTATDATAYHLVTTAEGHEHLHARCRRCGQVVVLRLDAMRGAIEQVASTTALALEPESSDLVGVCGDCSATSRDTA